MTSPTPLGLAASLCRRALAAHTAPTLRVAAPAAAMAALQAVRTKTSDAAGPGSRYAPGSGINVPDNLTPEQQAIQRENLEKSAASQAADMRSYGVGDHPYRDPDPHAGFSQAGTVTGTVEEFERAAAGQGTERALKNNMQDPEDTRAKEAHAASIGYDADEQARMRREGGTGGDRGAATPSQTRIMTGAAPNPLASQGIPGDDARAPTARGPVTGPNVTPQSKEEAKRGPATMGERMKRAAGEAWETLKHGVNNPGQPGVEEKLKQQ